MNKYLIKIYFKKGLYTKEQLNTFVKAGFISEQEKQEIMEG